MSCRERKRGWYQNFLSGRWSAISREVKSSRHWCAAVTDFWFPQRGGGGLRARPRLRPFARCFCAQRQEEASIVFLSSKLVCYALDRASSYLQSEGERIRAEVAHYAALAGAASASVKIIFDVLRAWRTTGHPAHNQSQASAFEMTDAVIEDASDWGDGPSRSFG